LEQYRVDLEDARTLALGLMSQHRLTGWRLVFDNAKTRAGVCRSDRKEIGLSRALTRLHSQAQVTDTLLHEIAHALVGSRHGHDRVWRTTALSIGSSGARCVPEDAPRVDGAWVGVCPAGHRRTAHRSPRRVRSCRQCSGVFDPSALFVWTYRGRPAQMHASYAAELAGIQGRTAEPASPSVSPSSVSPSSVSPSSVSLSSVSPSSVSLRVGDRVRLTGGGKYGGLVGVVEKRGRTRYQVQTDLGVLSAPFTLVEPISAA
jgi:predicted SprT family Zn-dependent metalloprotease